MTWSPPIHLDNIQDVSPTIRPWAEWVLSPLAWSLLALPKRVQVEIEGLDSVPFPAILAMNHTHYIDWLPVRWAVQRQGHRLSSFAKPRPYQAWAMRTFLNATGNIPLASRGYVISADLRCVLDRAPTEEEYRTLRDLADGTLDSVDAPSADMQRVLNTPRTVLGRPFDPTTETYGEMVNQVFGALARESISLARIALDRGSSLVIAPQGVFTSRLTKGRIGGVQFAAALGLPMIPVGVSGMLEAYPNQGLRSIGGTVHLRFGAPVDISLPTDHIPFDKACEVRFAAQLESETQRVMEAINSLLEPAYQWDDNPEGDGIQGVARFMD